MKVVHLKSYQQRYRLETSGITTDTGNVATGNRCVIDMNYRMIYWYDISLQYSEVITLDQDVTNILVQNRTDSKCRTWLCGLCQWAHMNSPCSLQCSHQLPP